MNYIIKYDRNMAGISNSVEARSHKHWMMQFFLSRGKPLNIEVGGQHISCNAILVNVNTRHAFSTANDFHFTMLIDPTTELGCRMRRLLMNRPFYIFPNEEATIMQHAFEDVFKQKEKNAKICFVKYIVSLLNNGEFKNFDDRVIEILNLLENCSDENHQLKRLSEKTFLSESRLAHLFKEETGIPLKSYIVLHKLLSAYEDIFSGKNITTAALNAGFDSSSHLASTNKAMTGMSATGIIKNSEFLKAI